MRRVTRVAGIIVASIAAALGIAFATGNVTFDHYGAYGVSIGSDTRYCSADWAVRGLETPLPMVTCETAR